MNISENLFPLLVALVIQTVSAHERKSKTHHCPCDEFAWSMRGKQFGCERGNYTCILTVEDELIETCIAPYRIFEKEDGCPYVKTFVQGFGPQIGGKLSPCDVKGCPPTNHSAYYITELYTYPACWIPMTERANMNGSVDFKTMCFTANDMNLLQKSSDPNAGRAQSQNGHSLLLITLIPAVCVTVIIAIISVVFLKQRHHKQRQRQEDELSTEDNLLSHTCKP